MEQVQNRLRKLFPTVPFLLMFWSDTSLPYSFSPSSLQNTPHHCLLINWSIPLVYLSLFLFSYSSMEIDQLPITFPWFYLCLVNTQKMSRPRYSPPQGVGVRKKVQMLINDFLITSMFREIKVHLGHWAAKCCDKCVIRTVVLCADITVCLHEPLSYTPGLSDTVVHVDVH